MEPNETAELIDNYLETYEILKQQRIEYDKQQAAKLKQAFENRLFSKGFNIVKGDT